MLPRITIANTTAQSGGAARAAQRLYAGLQQWDIPVDFISLYSEKETTSKYGLLRHKAERVLTKIVTKPDASYFSVPVPLLPDTSKIKQLNTDILHLHWINGFISLKQLARLQVPIVWTLHDMWLFTGGCHYDQHCDGYKQQCKVCPMLRVKSLAHQQWQRKKAIFDQLNLTVVTPSNWLAREARKSSLLQGIPVEVISNGIDTTTFQPGDKQAARKVLNIATDAKVILVGAVQVDKDPRKGLDLLQEALRKPALQQLDNIMLLVLGSTQENTEQLGNIKVQHTGFLKTNAQLKQAFNAADITVVPSRQENLANMLAESLACGTPVAGFDIGGNSDSVQHQQTGWLSPAFDTEHLAKGLADILQNQQVQQTLSTNARQLAIDTLNLSPVAQQHLDLYRSLL